MKTFAWGLIALILSAGCATTFKEMCIEDLAELDREVVQRLRALRKMQTGRMIASRRRGEEPTPAYRALSLDEQEDWMEWSFDRLVQVQSITDASRADPALRKTTYRLAGIANDMVFVRGFSGSGDAAQIEQALRRVQSATVKVRKQACR